MHPLPHLALGLALALTPALAAGQDLQHGHDEPLHVPAADPAPTVSPYAGWEGRGIKSLSDADIAALEAGTGWGLALAAELNGVPGPAHVLELAEELGLSAEQRAITEQIHARMTEQAKLAGARLIAAEAVLEEAFRLGGMPPQALYGLIMNAGRARSELRFIHLSTHLQMPHVLTQEQVTKYRKLRGYAAASDPCNTIPEGHDPDMWKAHNGCK